MTEKSHVSMEQQICVVCGQAFDTGSILLDRRLRASLERYTTTGWGLCVEHRRLYQEGFIALVECDPQKSGNPAAGARLKLGEAYRTGRLAHVKRDVFMQIFDLALEPGQPCVFVEPAVIERLQTMTPPASSD